MGLQAQLNVWESEKTKATWGWLQMLYSACMRPSKTPPMPRWCWLGRREGSEGNETLEWGQFQKPLFPSSLTSWISWWKWNVESKKRTITDNKEGYHVLDIGHIYSHHHTSPHKCECTYAHTCLYFASLVWSLFIFLLYLPRVSMSQGLPHRPGWMDGWTDRWKNE